MIRPLVLCSLVEAGVVAMLTQRPAWSPLFGPAHLAVTLAAVRIARRSTDWRAPGGWTIWLGAAFGPVGMLVMRLAMPILSLRLLRFDSPRLALPEPDDDHHDQEDRSIHVAPLSGEPVNLPDPALIGSLVSVFRHGTVADRQAAIETVVASYEPRLSGIVARGLIDDDQTIRALAASASTRAGQLLLQRRRRLERAVERAGRADERLALARLLADHGEHDVLISDTARGRLRADAVEELEGAIAVLPRVDPRYPAAEALLHRLRPRRKDPTRLPLATALDLLIRSRDVAGLARRCAMDDAAALPPTDPLYDVVRFWRGRAA